MADLQKFFSLDYILNLFKNPQDMVLILIIGTVILISILFLVFLLSSERKRIGERKQFAQETKLLNSKLVQIETVLASDEQLLFVWTARDTMLAGTNINAASARVIGGLQNVIGLPKAVADILNFEKWIEEAGAKKTQEALVELAQNGKKFTFFVKTRAVERVEMSGHVVGHEIIFRVKDLKEDRLDLARGNEKWSNLERQVERYDILLNNCPLPSWLRDDAGKLVWVNAAYIQAVEAEDSGNVIQDKIELIAPADVYKARQYFVEADKVAQADKVATEKTEDEHSEPENAEKPRATNNNDGDVVDANFTKISQRVIEQEVYAVVKGERCTLKIRHQKIKGGIIATAYDTTELEQARDELKRYNHAHKQTLDKLKTAIAQFGPDQNLEFFNSAYQDLFGMQASFLESRPSLSMVLEEIRNLKKMPEQANFKTWRDAELEAFRQVEPSEKWWHLPNGMALHIVADPHPFGGVTFLYDDVTEHLALESKYQELDQTQSETLDKLTDGVAVFGPNGDLQIFNPTFAKIWHFKPEELDEKPHVKKVLKWCQKQSPNSDVWETLTTSVTAIVDERKISNGRIDCLDGIIVEYSTIPLPNGATLMTFTDVTIIAKSSRLLEERNEALMTADQLKTDFISHVSYQFREPLTNILGFSEMLEGQLFGDLNPKQLEYVDIIRSSSFGLRALINNILDLASIDADRLELRYDDIKVAELIDDAILTVEMPVKQKNIVLNRIIMPAIGQFEGDAERISQVLYNLLANAIFYSEKDSIVSIGAEKENDHIRLWVRDAGAGISEDKLKNIFAKFYSDQTVGAGLGLSLAQKLVEFHGGEVKISSEVDKGTIVSCYFPIKQKPRAILVAEPIADDMTNVVPMHLQGEVVDKLPEINLPVFIPPKPEPETEFEIDLTEIETENMPAEAEFTEVDEAEDKFAAVDLDVEDDVEMIVNDEAAFEKASTDISEVNDRLEEISVEADTLEKMTPFEQMKKLRQKKLDDAQSAADKNTMVDVEAEVKVEVEVQAEVKAELKPEQEPEQKPEPRMHETPGVLRAVRALEPKVFAEPDVNDVKENKPKNIIGNIAKKLSPLEQLRNLRQKKKQKAASADGMKKASETEENIAEPVQDEPAKAMPLLEIVNLEAGDGETAESGAVGKEVSDNIATENEVVTADVAEPQDIEVETSQPVQASEIAETFETEPTPPPKLALDPVIMPGFETETTALNDAVNLDEAEKSEVEPSQNQLETDIKQAIRTAENNADGIADVIADIVKQDEDEETEISPSGLKVRAQSKAVFADSKLAALYKRRRQDEKNSDYADQDNVE